MRARRLHARTEARVLLGGRGDGEAPAAVLAPVPAHRLRVPRLRGEGDPADALALARLRVCHQAHVSDDLARLAEPCLELRRGGLLRQVLDEDLIALHVTRGVLGGCDHVGRRKVWRAERRAGERWGDSRRNFPYPLRC